jgi:hypothetical protein
LKKLKIIYEEGCFDDLAEEMTQEELANKIGTKKAISHVLKMANATSSFLNYIKFVSLAWENE